jgi:hypothetical protein
MTLLVGAMATVASFAVGAGYATWSARQAPAAAPAVPLEAASTFSPAAPFALADPPGDAKELGLTRVGYGPGCLIDCMHLPTEPHEAGPGADAFDILGVGLQAETPDAFVLALKVAHLTKGFPELASPGADRRVGEYSVCWKPAPDNATRCALLDVVQHHDDATLDGSFHILGADSCNDWAWCGWQVRVDATYGAPGEVRFTVPKALAAADGAPLALAEMRATAGWFATNKAIPLWHFAWTAHANGDHRHEHVGLLEPADVADRADATHEPVALTPSAPGPWPSAPGPLMTPGLGNLAGGGGIHDDPSLDLVAFDLREEGTDLVASYQMASFAAMPSYDLQFATIFGVRGGTTFEVGLMQANGVAYGYAGRCVSFGCHDGFLQKMPYRIDPATGTIDVRVPRATWTQLEDGAVVDLMIAYTMFGEANVDIGNAGAPLYGNVHSGSLVDVAFGGAPYVMGTAGITGLAPVEHHH